MSPIIKIYQAIKNKIYRFLKNTESWTKTDMIYLAKGGFWLGSVQTIATGFSFILSIAFANLLPPDTYGVYRYILSILGLLTIPTLRGVNTAVTRAVAQGFDGTINQAVKAKIYWSSLGAIASLGVSLYYFWQGNYSLSIAFLVCAIFLPFMDSFAVYDSFLEGKKLYKNSAIYLSITQGIATTSIIVALFFTSNLVLILTTYLASYTLIRLAWLLYTIKRHKTNNQADPTALKFGLHLSVIKVLGSLGSNLDNILLWHFVGATQVAIYALALSPARYLTNLVKYLHPLALPKFSSSTPAEIKKTLPPKLWKLFLVSATVILGYIIIAPLIYRIFFPKYLASIFYTRIFALTLLFQPRALLITALTAFAKQKSIYAYNLAFISVKILLLIILLPKLGILGAILSTLGAEIAGTAISSYLFIKM